MTEEKFVASETDFLKYLESLESLELQDDKLIKIRDEAIISMKHSRLWFSHSLREWNGTGADLLNELEEPINNNSPLFAPAKKLFEVDKQIILSTADLIQSTTRNLRDALLRGDEVFLMKQKRITVPVFGKLKTDLQKKAFIRLIDEKLNKIKESDLSSVLLKSEKYLLHKNFGSLEGSTEEDLIIDQMWSDYIEEGKDTEIDAEEGDEVVEGKEQNNDSETEQ